MAEVTYYVALPFVAVPLLRDNMRMMGGRK
jgi:hypothetical protein